jgi:hypothetical protein
MKSNEYAFMEIKLNFPELEFRIEVDQCGKLNIFDSLRKKFLVLTPEEWVRQHMIWFLISQFQYPRSLFALEKGLVYNTVSKRFDILVFDSSGAPFLLIECKAPEVKLSQSTLEQVAVYNTQVKAPFLGITNGLQHVFLTFDNKLNQYRQLRDIPHFPQVKCD